jgi:AAA15 family ATPase/GTPase
MYDRIVIQGLRGIKKIEISDFKNVNLFVGKNNSGKTTVLESLFLLINPSNAELPLKINKFRGYDLIEENYWRTIFNKLSIDSRIDILAELNDIGEKRRLIITPRSEIVVTQKTSSLLEEKLTTKDSNSSMTPSINGWNLDFSITKNNKTKKYSSKIFMMGPSIKADISKEYQEKLTGLYVGSNINSIEVARIFNNVQIKKGLNRIIKILKLVEPSLENLSLGIDGLIYCDIGLDRLMPINVMGGGILRILHIVLAISDTPSGIVLIDEIENGLHYSSQRILWDAIFESAKEFDTQIFATTHSMECINAFSSSYSNSRLSEANDSIRLFRMERKGDDFKVVSYNNSILVASLEGGWEVR